MNDVDSRVYLDYCATTPLRAEAHNAMQAALEAGAYNPSSLHAEGRRSRALLDGARERVARSLDVSRKDVVFTGSGTEANNLAVLGAARAARKGGDRRHIVASAIEHKAVLHALDALREEGFDVTLIPVDERGVVDAGVFEAALRDDTILASVMYANNEIGTVQPVHELAESAHRRGALFHCDAIQTPAWLPLDVAVLGLDLCALSAHKFFGPKGVGALVARAGVALEPLVYGGGQEFGRRSGTENIVGIAGAAAALELAMAEAPVAFVRAEALRDRLERAICERIGDVRVNGAGAPRLPNVLNVSFAGVTAEQLLVRLDLAGVAVSAGSACTSGVLEPSHVIAALGIDKIWHGGAIRFSLGPATTQSEIDRVLDLLADAVIDLRRVKTTA